MKSRKIETINARIKAGEAVVLTAEEFKDMVRREERITPDDVDVVTCATCALMSGTAVLLSFAICDSGEFERAARVWLNGVPGFPGPCPNERLGIVDAIIYGTARASHEYGGGHLFRELVEGKAIEAKVETGDGRSIERVLTREDIHFARMFTTRSAFKNYMAFVNTAEDKVESIFSVHGLRGPYRECSVTGSGELNPLENDPFMITIGIGTRILVNGAMGYITGTGTRSSVDKPNLTVIADMKDMDPEFMGGFITSKGPECITSIAVPIPVLNEAVLTNLKVLDEDVKLPVADINDRLPRWMSSYGAVWHNTDLEIEFDAERCVNCAVCAVEDYCPTRAFSRMKGQDQKLCFNCGACVSLCSEGAFSANLGHITVNDMKVPITLRQSNRARANKLAERLKEEIIGGDFILTEPVGRLI